MIQLDDTIITDTMKLSKDSSYLLVAVKNAKNENLLITILPGRDGNVLKVVNLKDFQI